MGVDSITYTTPSKDIVILEEVEKARQDIAKMQVDVKIIKTDVISIKEK